ncbi:uncharacterized protein RBU33_027576 isoform 2-T2 [Hipposideros larvatus]
MAEMEDVNEKQYEARRPVQVTNGGGLWKDQPTAQTSHAPLVTDSEWLDLSAEEQLAWVQKTQDPRIAVGPQSPLEKMIKSLGGVHSSKVRQLLARKFQQENETAHKLKAMSFDFWVAKADERYYQLHQKMMLEKAWNNDAVPTWAIKTKAERPHSETTEDAREWDYVVSERELKHIKKHIHRAEQARGLHGHPRQLLPQRLPSKVLFTETSRREKDEKAENIQKTPRAKTQKHKVAWTKEQIQRHQDRMIRGRELTEQRNDKRNAQKLFTQARLPKSQVEKEEVKEFEWVTAYPIVQPHQEALTQVTILMEKSRDTKLKKPLRREFLSIPPFLKSQLEKNKIIF